MHWREIIRRPIITEKTNFLAAEYGQYTFVVDSRANKIQIKEAIELAWPNVVVDKVRIANMPAKRARRWRRVAVRKPGWKKAFVTLSSGSIELFEGV
ncbi:MAG: 50S ribosomal protein L23 [Ardenticatenaceae bacterium]|nr:50S ribosomal protein L23 [Anaerolineales bacterium]MCB8916799.1 50S ribosomal protein L23 [Ardenticatenaceae bacterium]